jgi:hypothetical protein
VHNFVGEVGFLTLAVCSLRANAADGMRYTEVLVHIFGLGF